MKTKLMAVVCLSSFCVAQAGSVLDEMQHCVRSLGDLNENGTVDANEVIDVLTYSAAAQNGNDASAVCGEGATGASFGILAPTGTGRGIVHNVL